MYRVKQNMVLQMHNIELIRNIIVAAAGHWSNVLGQLGIVVPDSPHRHAPCPACGGNDADF